MLWHLYGMQAPMVLMVHGFKPTKAECESSFEMTTTSFEQLMQYLVDNGWHAMTFEELQKMVETRKWKQKHFYLTFDDTYDTVYTQAYPVLKRLQIPFTMFITKGLIDKTDFMTMPHLQALAKESLCTIGCHGLEHKEFRYFSKNEVARHCVEEREWLEQTLGVQVRSFAYPYGRIVEVSNANRRLMPQLGFELAFSAIEGTIRSVWWTGKHYLPRVNVSETFVERFINGKFLRYKDCDGR